MAGPRGSTRAFDRGLLQCRGADHQRFSDDQYSRALESWEWLDLDGLTPRFASLFGDLFLEALDGSWWFLDTFEGQLTREWADHDAMAAALDTEPGRDRYLSAGLAIGAYQRRGLRLGVDEVYAWAPPPLITGSFDVDDIGVFDFVVVVFVAGRLHGEAGGRAAARPGGGDPTPAGHRHVKQQRPDPPGSAGPAA
nr:hypothetical protein [uncultured Actinoplanes sp.]